MKTLLVKLKFKTELHIGETTNILTKIDNIIHSDTLFSAIINMYCLIFGLDKTEILVQKIINENYLRISSAFYFYKDKLLVPKPFGIKLNSDDPENYKKIKKLRFIPFDLLYNPKKFWNLSKNEIESIYNINKSLTVEDERPRVSIDRITNSSNIYYISYYYLSNDSGMWFFLQVNPEVEKEVVTTIKVLGDEGIGGERTYGFGLFYPTFEEYKLPNVEDQSLFINLSLTNPTKEEIASIKYYSIKTRKGYIYSPYISGIKHKEINVLEEGSVFNSEIKGRAIDVTPKNFSKHKVYKFYTAFCLPVSFELFKKQ
ncbi:MAG: type III-A CRISPR-associated RAMP protein Csm4 [Candidatus Calescibacterium sp.]|nr:type III-A CRISPR-associated RAMP protein Csm4 [Candidatus Calescibacterium sp.]MDW8133155.1 type III-A CRISPR-associated RAMP protein Csm4 [Candidatus Calescibacterium sp.]